MKNEIFVSMREQLVPGKAAQAALQVRLEETSHKKKEVPMKKYLAAVACVALLLCAYPAYNALKPQSPKLHSYITVEGSDPAVMKTYRQESVDVGGGDQDQIMAPEEVVEAMEAAGFSTEDIDQYQALGYEMTWAKWWKFVDEQKNSEEAESFNLASLEEFSRQELSVNTGVLDDPVDDLPAQLGADGYQLLMAHFGETLPDWYGGAYLDEHGTLMVLLVESRDPGDKSLELEVLDAVGNIPMGFTNAKYSRNELDRINDELLHIMDGTGIFSSFGIYDDQNRIILDVSEPLPEDILTAIAEIDPDDDAILIRVVEGKTAITDEWVKGPEPIPEPVVEPAQPGGVTVPDVDAVDPEEGEDPTPHFATEAPNDTPVPDEDLEAIEPYYDGGISDLPAKRPGKVESAHHDLLPREEE